MWMMEYGVMWKSLMVFWMSRRMLGDCFVMEIVCGCVLLM